MRLVSITSCDDFSVLFVVTLFPYAVVTPYDSPVVAGSLVTHVIATVLFFLNDAFMFDMIGAVVSVTGFRLNTAFTVAFDVIGTVHVPSPVHPPVHPANVEPVDESAVSVMLVPELTVCEQSDPHDIPVPVIVPCPVPDFVVIRV